MSNGARVESLDALKAFRVSLFKFAENAMVALGDAESEMHRTLMWLETEQLAYWQGQIRKRTELLGRAQEALRQKTLFKDATGRTQTGIDEMKIVAQCKRRLEEANQKLQNVKVYSRRLQKEIEVYKGSAQRFATTVQADIPVYAAKIDRLAQTLTAYTELTPDDISRAASAEFSGEMARAAAQAAGYGDAGGADVKPAAEAKPAAAAKPKAPELPPEAYPKLRARTPEDHRRRAAPPGLMPTAGWATRPVDNADRDAFRAIVAEREPLDPADQIIVKRGSAESPMIYLERVDAKTEGDSGWYMGPAELPRAGEGDDEPANAMVADTPGDPHRPAPLEAMRVSDFLALRPDLQDALALPKGYLVVLGPSAVRAVLDANNRNVWSAPAPAPAATPLRSGELEAAPE